MHQKFDRMPFLALEINYLQETFLHLLDINGMLVSWKKCP